MALENIVTRLMINMVVTIWNQYDIDDIVITITKPSTIIDTVKYNFTNHMPMSQLPGTY